MRFAPEGVSSRHEVFWHHNVKPGEHFQCDDCKVVFSTGYTLKDILRVTQPKGLPTIPDWVHEGAIIGVQGGTSRMMSVLREVMTVKYI